MEEKRKGILNHLVGIHVHEGHSFFKKCTHNPKDSIPLEESELENGFMIARSFDNLREGLICLRICTNFTTFAFSGVMYFCFELVHLSVLMEYISQDKLLDQSYTVQGFKDRSQSLHEVQLSFPPSIFRW